MTPRSYADTIDDVVCWCELLASVLSSRGQAQIPTEDPTESGIPTTRVDEAAPDARATPRTARDLGAKLETLSSDKESLADELGKLVQLLDQGFLTEEEFRIAKKKLLGG